jgi:hypothetical protein
MSRCKLRTSWPIHFKLRTVIGIDSLTVCIFFGEISIFFIKIEISPKSIQTIILSIPITIRSLKWIGKGVLNLQCYIRKIALKSCTIWIFICPSLRRDVLWYTTVRLSVLPFHMSCSNLRTPWPIHFKFHRVIGIDGLPELWDFIHQILAKRFQRR